MVVIGSAEEQENPHSPEVDRYEIQVHPYHGRVSSSYKSVHTNPSVQATVFAKDTPNKGSGVYCSRRGTVRKAKKSEQHLRNYI